MSFRPLYAKRSKSLLTQANSLNQLVNQAAILSQLQDCINLYLPTVIKESCHVASFQGGTLTIYAIQAHWATRLRYQQNRLKQQLQQHAEFSGIKKIVIKVYPKPYTKTAEEHYLEMSVTTAQTIAETAKNISHPALKSALERLATHAK